MKAGFLFEGITQLPKLPIMTPPIRVGHIVVSMRLYLVLH